MDSLIHKDYSQWFEKLKQKTFILIKRIPYLIPIVIFLIGACIPSSFYLFKQRDILHSASSYADFATHQIKWLITSLENPQDWPSEEKKPLSCC